MRVVALPVVVLLTAGTVAPRLAAQQADGGTVYKQECKSCHGVNGAPPARAREQYQKIKTLGQDGFVSQLSVDSIVTILKNGIGKDMKSFSGKLNEVQMRAVAVYIKELAEKKRGSG
jgi:mono/diheme cytochrome c family protein